MPMCDTDKTSEFLIRFIWIRFKDEPEAIELSQINGNVARDTAVDYTRQRFEQVCAMTEFRDVYNYYYTLVFSLDSKSAREVLDWKSKSAAGRDKILKTMESLYKSMNQ